MPSVNRNITLECPVCKKSMRSDNLKRHKLKKHKNFNFQVTTIVKANVKDSGNPSVQDLESEILADNKLLDEKIELGEKISKVLTNTNANAWQNRDIFVYCSRYEMFQALYCKNNITCYTIITRDYDIPDYSSCLC